MNDPEEGRAVIIHSLDHAVAALAAAADLGRPVVLRSAPGAVAYLGANVFRQMVDQARAKYPDVNVAGVLDCGGDAGLALGALRNGIKAVRVDLPAAVKEKVRDIAAQCEAVIDDGDTPALDLLHEDDPRAACRRWLAGDEEGLAGDEEGLAGDEEGLAADEEGLSGGEAVVEPSP